MAAKEKKSTVVKHLKENEKEKCTDVPKPKRSRKGTLNESKLSPEQKSPGSVRRKRKDDQDGRATPVQKRARRSGLDSEELGTSKTPPVGSQKPKKGPLEKELEDLLDNATRRNTPSMPRNKRINEKEEEFVDSSDDKSSFIFAKSKKILEREIDDDNVSVKSGSTVSKGRRIEKEIEEDVLSVKSLSSSSKKNDVNEDDASSVKSLTRSHTTPKVGRKKKIALAALVVKKKILMKRGRPKKTKENVGKKEGKKAPKIKASEKEQNPKKKRIIKKPLKFQNKIKDTTRIRPTTLAIKNQKVKKAKLKLTEKKQIIKLKKQSEIEQTNKERLKNENNSQIVVKSETPDLLKDVAADGTGKKKKPDNRKQGEVAAAEVAAAAAKAAAAKAAAAKAAAAKAATAKAATATVVAATTTTTGSTILNDLTSKSKMGKLVKINQPKGKPLKTNPEGKKGRRESGIHFETTRSPDDSSVIIVQPRLGPKIRGNKQFKHILPKTEEISKRTRNILPKVVPKDVKTVSVPVQKFNQMTNSYFVQTLPKYNIYSANPTVVRRYTSNLDGKMPVATSDLPYVENSSFGSKLPSKEVIVTPSGIVLSGNKIISTGIQNSSPVCFNGSSSNGDISFTPPETLGKIPASGLLYQGNTTVIQPQSCPESNTAILIKRPESMSTSLISTTAGTLLINPSINSNGNLRVSNVKPHSVYNASDTIVSEKAMEGSCQVSGETPTVKRFKSVSTVELLPSIPVAKNVNELLIIKNKSNADNCDEKIRGVKETESSCKFSDAVGTAALIIKQRSELIKDKLTEDKKFEGNSRNKTLKNVRNIHGSDSELTFSEPECSKSDNEYYNLCKTISCEHISKSVHISEPQRNATLQISNNPIITSNSFVIAENFFTVKDDKLDQNQSNDLAVKETSPKVKGAIDVCRFSKENEAALKELGLDSDLDQTKSEIDSESPVKDKNIDTDIASNDLDISEINKKAKMKEEVDNVLREMPVRRITNLGRKPQVYSVSPKRMELKNPLVLKNNDYLSKSPSKPPTVIDKLLEKNKSLKKAEQEGKFKNMVRNLSENSMDFEVFEVRPKKQKETKTRKFLKESRKTANKKFVHGTQGYKLYERRGSNPEVYSNNYLTVQNQVANENVPLRRVTDPGRNKISRSGSIEYDGIQKVVDRRCSLPTTPASELFDPKNSKSVENENKSEKIKTIVVDTSKPVTNKTRGSERQPRVINIVTSNSGVKKGKNLMEEIGLNMDSSKKSIVNGDKKGRRLSIESSNSETENLQKIMEGLVEINADKNLSDEVPYFEKNSRKVEKTRASLDRKNVEASREKKTSIIDESYEDLITKEAILSALGLQPLKVSSEDTQKKKESVCQTEGEGYTGTLKAVIKIQRPEKKGSSKKPVKMVYKASSSSSSVSGQPEDSNISDGAEVTSKEDGEEKENPKKLVNGKSLVIPEKVASYSIHPGRVCSDVCTYCFGKFGLLDTPCHIEQLKDIYKKRKILGNEVTLKSDACLCDACFRFIEKKTNCSRFNNKKHVMKKRPVRRQICTAQNCNAESQHSIRKKLFLKLKKSIGRKVVLDPGKLERLLPSQTLTFCNRHIYWIDYFMSCGICKKRLSSVNMYRVTPEVLELNAALSSDQIPAILTENRFLCKICNCFASVRIKCKNPNEMSSTHRQFYETCRKRILKCHGVEVPDLEAETDKNNEHRSVRRWKKSSKPTATVTNENAKTDNDIEICMEKTDQINGSERGHVSHVNQVNISPKTNGNLDFGAFVNPSTAENNPSQFHLNLGNLNIGQDVRHSARSGDIQCFPTESELALRAHFELKPSAEDESAKTARNGFEKCTTTIQFSPETKNLYYNLQMPYGNQSSFFRHLILLEKYFRSGDLVISRNADPKAVNYISSVQNRIRSYEGVHNTKKSVDISPSLTILPQPVITESRNSQEIKSRPFTLTPMPSNSFSGAVKSSPLSQIQATVQNILPVSHNQNQGNVTSLLKSAIPTSSKFASHPKPEVSITSVTNETSPPTRVGQVPNKAPGITMKIKDNLRNLASNSQTKPNQRRAVILNRTVGGQKQNLFQVATGEGKVVHLTLDQFKKIQNVQIQKKQSLFEAKMLQAKDKSKPKISKETFNLKNLSPELEIEEVIQQPNGNEMFPLISEVRSLAGEDMDWEETCTSNEDTQIESFPKIPKSLSVSMTKIPPPNYSVEEESIETIE